MSPNPSIPQEPPSETPTPQDESTTRQKPIQFTSRNPPWTYLKLQLIQQPTTPKTTPNTPLDALTARTLLTSALSQFLGLTGTAIPIDLLKISPTQLVWIRVPREDAAAVVAALSSWIGGSRAGGGANVAWRVWAKGNYLPALAAGSGADLFATG